MILLTAEKIESLMTPKGGYNMATLEALGVPWPPHAGWKAALIGTQIGDRRWRAAERASKEVRHVFRGNARKRF